MHRSNVSNVRNCLSVESSIQLCRGNRHCFSGAVRTTRPAPMNEFPRFRTMTLLAKATLNHLMLVAIGCVVALSASTSRADGLLPIQAGFNILKPSTTGVPGEEVRVMRVDPQGNLWIAARWPFWWECALAMLEPHEQQYTPLPGGGFDTGQWTVWSNVDHPLPSVFIDDIDFTADGMVWIASEGGLTRFNRNATNPDDMWQTWNTSNSPLIVNGVEQVAVDLSGNLWVLNRQVNTVLGGLFKFTPSTNSWVHHPLQNGDWDFAPTGVAVGFDGNVYVTHEFASGFSTYNGTTWTYRSGGTTFSSVMQDQQLNLWFTGSIGSAGGVWKWNGASFQSWSLDVTGLSRGLDGTVYVSTWYGPIYRMIGGVTPEFFVDAQGLPVSVIERPNGDFFINNYGSTLALGRVRQYDSNGQLLRRMNTYNCGLPDYFISNIEKDLDGNVWFSCGEGGLSRMLGSDGSIPTRWRNWGNHNDFAEPYPWAGNEPMYCMWDSGDGYIWMGGNGVGKWNKATGTFEQFWNWQNSSLGAVAHTAFVRDKNDDIWVATDMYGLNRLNPETNDWEQKLFGPPGNTSNYVGGITRDIEGNLWVSTPPSLHFFDGTNWFAIGPFHGSPAEWPTDIIADPSGGVWIGADNGLIRYKDATWTIYNMSNSPMPTNHVVSMDIRSDGLLGFTVVDFQSVTPFPHGVVLFDGTNWQVFQYGTHPLPHYQLEDVEFDAEGDIWVSTISEGVTEIVLHRTPPATPGDINGDNLVNVADLLAVINAWGTCPGSPQPCPADIAPSPNGDGVVNIQDLLMIINNWG